MWRFASENELLYCLRETKGWSKFGDDGWIDHYFVSFKVRLVTKCRTFSLLTVLKVTLTVIHKNQTDISKIWGPSLRRWDEAPMHSVTAKLFRRRGWFLLSSSGEFAEFCLNWGGRSRHLTGLWVYRLLGTPKGDWRVKSPCTKLCCSQSRALPRSLHLWGVRLPGDGTLVCSGLDFRHWPPATWPEASPFIPFYLCEVRGLRKEPLGAKSWSEYTCPLWAWRVPGSTEMLTEIGGRLSLSIVFSLAQDQVFV